LLTAPHNSLWALAAATDPTHLTHRSDQTRRLADHFGGFVVSCSLLVAMKAWLPPLADAAREANN
jgi:hypothetical protein